MELRVDQREFSQFCADAYPPLVAALTYQCGDRFLAEELAQEALVRAGDRWDRVGTLDSPVGWAFRVGANLAASTFRRRAAERRALERMQARHALTERVPEPDTGDMVALTRALATLTRVQREVVVLRYYLDLSVETTAELLGMGGGAVRMASHRALAHLRTELGDPEGQEGRDG